MFDMLKSFKKFYNNLCVIFDRLNKKQVIPVIFGVCIVIALPTIHLGLIYGYFLLPYMYKRPVDPDFCSNTCWDSIFKGGYENNPAGYKHMYFNVTSNTLKIWILTVCVIICTYEVICYLVRLFMKGRLRLTMLALFISNVYAHYYTWWAFLNYWNDDFYEQWMHQIVFSVTEILSTIIVVYLCDVNNVVTGHLLLLIIDIAIFHVLASAGDQFITNIFYMQGDIHQLGRDIGFMIPDLFHVAIPVCMLCRQYKYKLDSKSDNITAIDIAVSLAVILSFVFFCHIL